jgi:hypothetical protein
MCVESIVRRRMSVASVHHNLKRRRASTECTQLNASTAYRYVAPHCETPLSSHDSVSPLCEALPPLPCRWGGM